MVLQAGTNRDTVHRVTCLKEFSLEWAQSFDSGLLSDGFGLWRDASSLIKVTTDGQLRKMALEKTQDNQTNGITEMLSRLTIHYKPDLPWSKTWLNEGICMQEGFQQLLTIETVWNQLLSSALHVEGLSDSCLVASKQKQASH
jgi:hypothetical protein